MLCVLFQKKAFLDPMDISVPWTIVGKEMFAKWTRDPTLNLHIKKKYIVKKKKGLSLELLAQFQFWKKEFS